MYIAGARIQSMKRMLIAWLVAGTLLLPGTSRAQIDFPPLPSITVDVSNGIGTIHFTAIGGRIFFTALLSVLAVVPQVPVDVYVGAILPDGRFVSLTGDPRAPTPVVSAAPVPLLANVVPAQTTLFRVVYDFTTGDLQGLYWLYGLILNAGANVLDLRTFWISSSFVPLVVAPPVTR